MRRIREENEESLSASGKSKAGGGQDDCNLGIDAPSKKENTKYRAISHGSEGSYAPAFVSEPGADKSSKDVPSDSMAEGRDYKISFNSFTPFKTLDRTF